MTSPPSAPVTVAVDGPSGSGKSTVAREVARRLGAAYLDTGAMYRAVTWAVQRAGVDPHDAAAVQAVAAGARLEVGTDPAAPWVRVDGVPVDREVRSAEVTRDVSAVSAVPAVRALLVARQRAVLAAGPTVAEGRDIGPVVAPHAEVKVFLTARDEVRAGRRAAQDGAGEPVADVVASLARRDRLDSTRAVSPLRRADGAVEIDTSVLDVDGVVEAVLAVAAERGLHPVGSRS